MAEMYTPSSRLRLRSLSFFTSHISQMVSRMGYHSRSMVVGLLTRAEQTSTARNRAVTSLMG